MKKYFQYGLYIFGLIYLVSLFIPDKEATTTRTNVSAISQINSCTIKGNISFNSKQKIYHLPNCPYYSSTKIDERYGERWFCTEQEALDAGWRKALNCS